MDEATILNSWSWLPHTLAQKCSGGRWKPYPHLTYLSHEITYRIALGNAKILVCMHPRVGKSEFLSFWIPVWYNQNFPGEEIILASYEASIAEYFGRRVRDEIETNNLLTNNILRHARSANDFRTTENGGMKTSGIGGPIVGRGANLFLIDDIFKNWQEAMSETRRRHISDWFYSTAMTRLEPNASMIILMTRWHEYDLAGELLANDKEWVPIILPALAEDHDPLGRKPGEALCPERFPIEVLLKIKGRSKRVWDGLYQQHPVSAEGEIWKKSYWQFYKEKPKHFDQVLQSWDMNFKEGEGHDFVVGQVWGRLGINYYLLDSVRGQWGFKDTLTNVSRLSQAYPEAGYKLIENKANGPAIENVLCEKISGILLVEPKGGKVARAIAAEPTLESGHVFLPEIGACPWVQDFIDECASFPKGKHDDQVDTASQAINFFEERLRSDTYDIY